MRKILTLLAATSLLANCSKTDWTPQPYATLQNAEWTRDAVLYQINTRQFTPEGTFAAAQKQLPRIKALGADIIWLMPIHPIGVKNRKGGLGSPYSVKDYYAVNPEFGTKADLKAFVDEAHRLGLHVILDLVANHTAWDNQMAIDHPDWYEKDWKGSFRPTPWWDWSDIIDLDWTKPGVREHVGKAMEMWVRDFGIDGYRADVAGYVPLDFWESERARLEKIRPVFMLAEWKTSELQRKAFDASYAWDWHGAAKKIAQGEADATALYEFYAEHESAWPKQAMRLTYIENHDSNSWEGTARENFGPALEALTALSFTGEGLSMVYSGQEACNARRLAFFEKDPIDWKQGENCAYGKLLHDLIAFRKANPALANGKWGARMEKLDSDKPKQLFGWVRKQDGNHVVGLFNLSATQVSAKLTDAHAAGEYKAFGSGEAVTLKDGNTVDLPAWGFRLLSRGGAVAK
jgi:glycosidase